ATTTFCILFLSRRVGNRLGFCDWPSHTIRRDSVSVRAILGASARDSSALSPQFSWKTKCCGSEAREVQQRSGLFSELMVANC
ncbi:unnamed protein product, partial [Mycena citricolor]